MLGHSSMSSRPLGDTPTPVYRILVGQLKAVLKLVPRVQAIQLQAIQLKAVLKLVPRVQAILRLVPRV